MNLLQKLFFLDIEYSVKMFVTIFSLLHVSVAFFDTYSEINTLVFFVNVTKRRSNMFMLFTPKSYVKKNQVVFAKMVIAFDKKNFLD